MARRVNVKVNLESNVKKEINGDSKAVEGLSKEFKDLGEGLASSTKKSNESLKKNSAELKRLSVEAKKAAIGTEQLKQKEKEAAAELKKASTETKKAATETEKLRQKERLVSIELKKLSVESKKLANETAKLNKEKKELAEVEKKSKKALEESNAALKKKGGLLGSVTGKTLVYTASLVALSVVTVKFTKDFIKAGTETIKQAQKVETQFKTLLGSAEKAQERYGELAKFAAVTPFRLKGVAGASKILQTLTEGTLATGDGLRLVGDAAAIAGTDFQNLAVWVGRAYSGLQSNRPVGEAMMRLQELGLVSGKTRNRIEELQKAAKGKEAWLVLRKELEKTKGGMEELAKTFEGKTSTMVDNIGLLSSKVLEQLGFNKLWAKSLDETINVLDVMNEGLEIRAALTKKGTLTLTEATSKQKGLNIQLKNLDKTNKEAIETKKQEIIINDELVESLKREEARRVATANVAKKIAEQNIKNKQSEGENAAIAELEANTDRRNEIVSMGLQADLENYNKSLEEKRQLDYESQLEKERIGLEFENRMEMAEKKRVKREEKRAKQEEKRTRQQYATIAQMGADSAALIFNDSKLAAQAKIGVSTAAATMRLYEDFPLPAALALTPFVVGVGVKQIADVQRQKFTDGGIVNGNSRQGDKISVDVNSEEMVLNKSQQARLFEIANGEGSSGGAVNNYYISDLFTQEEMAQKYTNLQSVSSNLALEPQV